MPARRFFLSTARCPQVILVALLAAATSLSVAAQDAASSPRALNEHAQIAAERAAVEARFDSAAKECRTHFVVTSCVDDAKRTRRESLDRLRARQRVGDDARRQERAEERRKAIGEKAVEDARRDAERASRSAGAASGTASAATSAADLGHSRKASSPSSAASGHAIGRDKPHGTRPAGAAKATVVETPQERQAREAKSRAAFESRQQEAAQHRDESTARALHRASVKPPSASLPVPSASVPSGASR